MRKTEERSAMYNIAIFLSGLGVVSTTLLNVAFTLMPHTMIALVRHLFA